MAHRLKGSGGGRCCGVLNRLAKRDSKLSEPPPLLLLLLL